MKKYILPFIKLIGFLVMYYVIYLVLMKVSSSMLNLSPQSAGTYPSFIATLISLAISLIVFAFIVNNVQKTSTIHFNISGAKDFIKGIQYGIVCVASFILILLITHQAEISTHTRSDKNFYLSFILEIVCFFIFACVTELLYRGFALNYLKEKYTTSGAIIISSLIYAVFHAFYGYTTPVSVLNYFLIGCILCIVVLKHNSLKHAIGLHFSFGIILFYIFSVPNSGVSSAGLFNLSYENIELLNGGNYGAEGGLIFTFCALIFLFILYIIGKRNSMRQENFTVSRKNICVAAFLLVIAILYVPYNLSIWKAENRKFDTVPVKSVVKSENVNNYKMDWRLDVSNKIIYGTEEVDYINTSQDNLSEVCFHMYPAAFKKYNGDIKIQHVNVDGVINKFDISGSDGTILGVPLENALSPGKRVKIKMEYVINIPQRSNNGFADRFAYSNNSLNLGNCFPIAAVYENGSFDRHPYDEKGDAFYSETSNFSVTVTAPSKYTLAVTGEINKTQDTKDGNKKWSITANSVRDFALVASDKLKMVQGNVNGTIIRSYAYNEAKAEKALNISADAISTYNRRIGEYPYGTCSVVETDLGGGMEYPTMVMILSDAYDDVNLSSIQSEVMYGKPTGEFEFIIVHELAHQWWYGLIGDDEFNEAYVDEPLAQFYSLLYIKDKYGENAFDTTYNRSIVMTYNAMKSSLTDTNYKRPLNKFKNDTEYDGLIYEGLPIKIKQYYDKVGDSKFNSIIQDTFKKYEFKILKGKDYPIPLG